MNIRMINGNYETLVDGSKSLPKDHPHQINVQHLDDNPQVKTSIEDYVLPIVDELLGGNQPYLISGKIAVDACNSLSLEQNEKNHGYVGSLLFESLLSNDDIREVIGYREKTLNHSVTYFLA